MSPVLDMGEATEDDAAVAREAFPGVGGVPQPAPAPRFSAHRGPAARSPRWTPTIPSRCSATGGSTHPARWT